jgi:uncharacterized membrane protein YeaQ/YmgE (transglycosylase-associated protein family)
MEDALKSLEDIFRSLETVGFAGVDVLTLTTWFLAGLVASMLLMGRRPIGRLGDMVVGVVGGLLGGWVSETTGWRLSSLITGVRNDDLRDFVGEFLTAVAGAIVVLLILRILLRRSGG